MNDKIKQLAEQAGIKRVDLHYTEEQPPYTIVSYRGSPDNPDPLAKFAELIVKECARLNRLQSYELSGVVVDTEDGHGFDSVCLNTVKRVEQYLAGNDLLKHFGVEE